jgi:HlyD family secretion protein
MKRAGLLALLIITLAGAVVAGAGYLGKHSVHGGVPPAVQAPATVQVTRGDVQDTVTAPGQVVGTRQVTLALEAGGRLARVHVRPGQAVRAGEVLARLDPGPLEAGFTLAQAEWEVARAQLAQLQAGPSEAERAAALLALAQAEAKLNRLLAGPTAAELAAAEAGVATARSDLARLQSLPDPDQVAQAQAELDRARATMQQAQAAYDRVKDRPDIGMMPQALELQQATLAFEAARSALAAANRPATAAELSAAQAGLASARAALAQLRAGPSDEELRVAEMQWAKTEADLARLTAGPTAADLMQARARLQSAEQALGQAQASLEAAALVAPFDGIVLEVRANEGERVAAGTGLILLLDPDAVEIEATVIEEDLPLVQAGQPVELFFDAQPEAEVQGRVARIVPRRIPGDRPLYPIYVSVEDLPEGLMAGMTADASIGVAVRHDVLRLPRAVVRARADATATVQVWSGTQAQERRVRVGLRGDAYVEILDGLVEGEEVVAE